MRCSAWWPLQVGRSFTMGGDGEDDCRGVGVARARAFLDRLPHLTQCLEADVRPQRAFDECVGKRVGATLIDPVPAVSNPPDECVLVMAGGDVGRGESAGQEP